MTELRTCECHFIRCLKPNEEKKPCFWNGNLVLQQIRYLGVLESIKVRKESFPVRRLYRLFFHKYEELRVSGPSFLRLDSENADFKELTKELVIDALKSHPGEFALYGRTKIFLKNNTFLLIEKKYHEKMVKKNEKAIKIQRAFYRFKQMTKLRQRFKALTKIKGFIRVRLEYLNFQKIRKSVRILQGFYKKRYKSREIMVNRLKCIVIQTYIRRYLAFRDFNSNLTDLSGKIKIIVSFIRKGILKRKKKRDEEILLIVRDVVFEKTWMRIEEKKAIFIQKYIRRFVNILRNSEIVNKIRNFRLLYKEIKAALLIQKNVRSLKLRKRYFKMRHSVNKIKGLFRMKALSEKFRNLKRNVLIIQKIIKPFIAKRILNNKMNNEYFLEQAVLLKEQKDSLELLLYGNTQQNTSKIKDFHSPNKSNRQSFLSPTLISPLREITPYTSKNVAFFMLLLDVDFMVSLLYI